MSVPGWDHILDPGEQIVWQGQPDGKIVFRVRSLAGVAFGLFFSGFAVFWMIGASQAGGYFWMFGLIHFFVGLCVAFGSIFWSAASRRHTWYTLTNRRAFIATDIPLKGRTLKSYPISPDTVLEYDAGDPATIHFAHEYRSSKNGSTRHAIGFERIADGADVYAQIRAIQRESYASSV